MLIYTSVSEEQFEILPTSRWKEATHWFPRNKNSPSLELKILNSKQKYLNREENYTLFITKKEI
jgi:hypothetical protein